MHGTSTINCSTNNLTPMGGKEGRVLEECYFCIHSQCLTTDRPSDCDHRNVDDKKVLPASPPHPRPSVSIHGAEFVTPRENRSSSSSSSSILLLFPPQRDVFNPSADTRLQQLGRTPQQRTGDRVVGVARSVDMEDCCCRNARHTLPPNTKSDPDHNSKPSHVKLFYLWS